MNKAMVIFVLFWLPGMLVAQISLPIEEIRRGMSKGEQPGFMVKIPEAQRAEAEKSWMREVRKGTKAKPIKSKEEISINGAVLSSVRHDAINVYARFYQDGKDLLLYAFFEIDSVFFDGSRDPDLAGNIRQFLREFAVTSYREAYSKTVKAEEKELQNQEKSMSVLESNNKKAERAISKNERRIADLQQTIKEMSADEDRKAVEIDSQKDLIITLNNFPEEQKTARSKLKSLEKERRKLKRSRESSFKRIDKLEEGIKGYRRNIRINEESLRQKNLEIQKQRDKVLEMKNKLSGIR